MVLGATDYSGGYGFVRERVSWGMVFNVESLLGVTDAPGGYAFVSQALQ